MGKYYSIRIDQGATWTKVIQVNNPDGTPRNLTGYSAKMDLKASYGAVATLLQLSSPANGITINAGAGQITVTITAAQSAAMSWTTGVYDLKITSGSVSERILEGSVGVFPQVTV